MTLCIYITGQRQCKHCDYRQEMAIHTKTERKRQRIGERQWDKEREIEGKKTMRGTLDLCKGKKNKNEEKMEEELHMLVMSWWSNDEVWAKIILPCPPGTLMLMLCLSEHDDCSRHHTCHDTGRFWGMKIHSIITRHQNQPGPQSQPMYSLHIHGLPQPSVDWLNLA